MLTLKNPRNLLKNIISTILICAITHTSFATSVGAATHENRGMQSLQDFFSGKKPFTEAALYLTRQPTLIKPVFEELASLTSSDETQFKTLYCPIVTGAFDGINAQAIKPQPKQAYALAQNVTAACQDKKAIDFKHLAEVAQKFLDFNGAALLKNDLARHATWTPPTGLHNEPWLLFNTLDVLAWSRLAPFGPLPLWTSYGITVLQDGSLIEFSKLSQDLLKGEKPENILKGLFWDGENFVDERPNSDDSDAHKVIDVATGEAVRTNTAVSITNKYGHKIQQSLFALLLLRSSAPLALIGKKLTLPIYTLVTQFLQGKASKLPASTLSLYSMARQDLVGLKLIEEIGLGLGEIFVRGPLAILTLLAQGEVSLAYTSFIYWIHKANRAINDQRKISMLTPALRPYVYATINLIPIAGFILDFKGFYIDLLEELFHELQHTAPFSGKFSLLSVQIFGVAYTPLFIPTFYYTANGQAGATKLLSKLTGGWLTPARVVNGARFMQAQLAHIPYLGAPLLNALNKMHEIGKKRGPGAYNFGVYFSAVLGPIVVVGVYAHAFAQEKLKNSYAALASTAGLGLLLMSLYSPWAKRFNVLPGVSLNQGFISGFKAVFSTALAFQEFRPVYTYLSSTPPLQAATSITAFYMGFYPLLWAANYLEILPLNWISTAQRAVVTGILGYNGLKIMCALANQYTVPLTFWALEKLSNTGIIFQTIAFTALAGITHFVISSAYSKVSLAISHFSVARLAAGTQSAIMNLPTHTGLKWGYRLSLIPVGLDLAAPLMLHVLKETKGHVNWLFVANAAVTSGLIYSMMTIPSLATPFMVPLAISVYYLWQSSE